MHKYASKKNYEALVKAMIDLYEKANNQEVKDGMDIDAVARQDLNRSTAIRKLEDVVTSLSYDAKKLL